MTATRDPHITILARGNQRYVFCWSDGQESAVGAACWRWAIDKRLRFGFADATAVMLLVNEESKQEVT